MSVWKYQPGVRTHMVYMIMNHQLIVIGSRHFILICQLLSFVILTVIHFYNIGPITILQHEATMRPVRNTFENIGRISIERKEKNSVFKF